MNAERHARLSESPLICSLSVSDDTFEQLTTSQQVFAHHTARAAWHGTRVILRQVSPESSGIFDFILELYRACDGNWQELQAESRVASADLQRFLEYAASFLSNVGNYWGSGDQKFVPDVSHEVVRQLSSISSRASSLFDDMGNGMMTPRPYSLGYPSDTAQSSYYPGNMAMSEREIAAVTETLNASSIEPENTRIHKSKCGDALIYDVLQASVQTDDQPQEIGNVNSTSNVRLVRGDYKEELRQVTENLEEAKKYAANATQEKYLSNLCQSLRSGDMNAYKESQKLWVKDTKPAIETIFGFVEPYRDPYGVRAEFEGLVAIVNKKEAALLETLAQNSGRFVRTLPWAVLSPENDGKGPFEKETMDTPDFTSLHTIAYCSSIIFPGINLPNYNDIRQTVGFKNVMITNSMTNASSQDENLAFCLDASERKRYLEHRRHAFHLWVVFHELFGHGTSKLLTEHKDGSANFDINSPPINPLNGKAIDSWYKGDQTWTGLFGDIATTVDECRAECVGADLMSEKELLALCGYTDETEVTCGDLEYNMYLQLGVAGLRSLENYNPAEKKWGQAHSRGHFAIFKSLLEAPRNFIVLNHDAATNEIKLSINRGLIASHGRPALRDLLLKLHIYRCTADVKRCRAFYEGLTVPGPRFLEWRRIVLAHPVRRKTYVQPNTFLVDGKVELRQYEATVEGVIKSWAERRV